MSQESLLAFPTIGWIGTGVMGVHQARHLIEKGYKLQVYNRTASKAQPLIDLGAEFKQPAEIAQACNLVFLMLGYPSDVEEIVFGEEKGILQHLQSGAILVDHTTSKPDLAVRIATECLSKGVISIDAPVSGGDIGAKNGTLVSMCGGDEAGFAKVQPVIEVYSKCVRLHGPAGSGQHTKVVNQVVIAGSMIGVCEGIVYGLKAGLKMEDVLQTIGGGAASSFSLNYYAPKILQADMQPGFYVEHFVKDLKIALDECERMEIKLPGLKMVYDLYFQLSQEGGARLGTQALYQLVEKKSTA